MPVEVIEVLGRQPALAARLAESAVDAPGAALVLALGDDCGDPERSWVSEGSVETIAALASLTRDGTSRAVCLLVWSERDSNLRRRAAAEATLEAARGLAQVATLEDSTRALRVNVVAGGPESEDDVLRTVEFLCSPASGFVAGSTFDLRSGR